MTPNESFPWPLRMDLTWAMGRIQITESGCWEWTGAALPSGYGTVSWKQATGRVTGTPAHRFVYRLARGPILQGLEIDHLCFNRGCVNPDHLEPVSHLENLRRSFHRGRGGGRPQSTLCRAGHALTPRNTYRFHNQRLCRECLYKRLGVDLDRQARFRKVLGTVADQLVALRAAS